MAAIISFSWTSAALIHGAKTVTRRDWDPDYARRFKAGDEVLAYDRQPRNGGKLIARLRLTDDVTLERDADAPDSDWAAEGFEWFQAQYGDHLSNGRDVSWEGFCSWREDGGSSFVVRFRVMEYLRGPLTVKTS